MTGNQSMTIAPRQDLECVICARTITTTDVGEHHVIHRSQGGEKGPTLTICSTCHAELHPEKQGTGWTIAEAGPERLTVVDGKTGALIIDKWFPPEGFRAASVLKNLESASQTVRVQAQNYFKYLRPDEMREVAHALQELDDENWMAMAKLLQVAHSQIPWGERGQKFEVLLQEFSIKKSHGYKLLAAIKELEDNPVFHNCGILDLSPDAVLLIASDKNPQKAIELYTDRKAENPRYSNAQFRRELASTEISPEAPSYCICPTCGARHLKR